jgi:hypothetical protein
MKQKADEKLVKAARYILITYFLASILLSLSIYLRLRAPPSNLVKILNIAAYVCTYYGVPLASLSWLLYFIFSPFTTMKRTTIKELFIRLLATIVCVLVFFQVVNWNLPEYSILWVYTFFVVSIVVLQYKPRIRLSSGKVLATMLLISILMPNISAFICYEKFLGESSSVITETGKANFVSKYIYNITAFGYPFRTYDDWWKFLLSGAGQCREMATATIVFMSKLNIDARKVKLAGEDHAFVEAKINGTWYVIDPGYFPSEILTRQQRAARRIAEFGAISYVIAYVGSSFVELTPYYVKTDAIVIRVTYDKEPKANAKIHLEHKFMGNTWNLPDSSLSFFTDGNGTVTFNIGALNYNTKAAPCEPYYWVYVNDRNTGYNVTSTGTGKTRLIEIDLAKLPH